MAWQDISSAPRDGTHFTGRKGTRKLRTWWGKTSHVPLYGWCHGRDVENIDLWQPTHWKPRGEPCVQEDHQ